MKKRIATILLLVSLMLTFFIAPAYAEPPSTPLFTTGLADDAGYYLQYYSSDQWKDLKTAHHWEVNTHDIAYCLDQTLDYPTGTQSYTVLNPNTKYSSKTLQGMHIAISL